MYPCRKTVEEHHKFEKERTEEVFNSLRRARSISKKRAADMAKNVEVSLVKFIDLCQQLLLNWSLLSTCVTLTTCTCKLSSTGGRSQRRKPRNLTVTGEPLSKRLEKLQLQDLIFRKKS